jgi:hypothetical protein
MTVFKQALLSIQNVLAYIVKDTRQYYKYGEHDCLVNEIIDTVNDSGTAFACIDKLFRFTYGTGLKDQTLAKGEANPGQSHNSAIAEIALSTAYIECVVYRVLYNNSGESARYYPVPITSLRRQGPNTYLYNELMGYRGRVTSEDVWLTGFDPKEDITSRLERRDKQIKKYGKQYGDIVYYFKKGVGRYRNIYCIPSYYAGIADIESDAGISVLERRNIKRGWRTPIIVSTGPIDKHVKDEGGKTQYDKFVEKIQQFVGEDAASVLHLEGATNEAKPEVKTISISEILDSTDKATDRIGKKVCRHMNVPPILVGFATPGQLGNVQELKNMMDLFRLTVLERQQLIKEAMSVAFPSFDWSLNPLDTFNEAPKV